MGIWKDILDNFNKAEFSISPEKKVKEIAEGFKESFQLTLVVYKGKQIADPELTLEQLNSKISKDIKLDAGKLKIKASMKVGEAEKIFEEHFGLTVQIKDKEGKKLVPNEITIGQAAREEYQKK